MSHDILTVTAYRSWTLCSSYPPALLQQLPPTSLYIHGSHKCNNLFQTPPCRRQISHMRSNSQAVQMTSPFGNVHVKNLALLLLRNFFLHEIFSYEMFSTQIFSNLRYVCMYVCMSVRYGYMIWVYELHTVQEPPSTLCSASAAMVVVRWRTRETEDDDWLGNELRGREDDWLFNSEMTDDRTTPTEDDLHASSFLRTLPSNPNNLIVDFPLLISPSKYEHVLLGLIGGTEQTTPHSLAYGDEWVTPLTSSKSLSCPRHCFAISSHRRHGQYVSSVDVHTCSAWGTLCKCVYRILLLDWVVQEKFLLLLSSLFSLQSG